MSLQFASALHRKFGDCFFSGKMCRYIVYVALLLSVILVVLATEDNRARFDNYRVYSFPVEKEHQLEALQEIEAHPDGLMFLEAPILGRTAELLAPPHKLADVQDLFESLNLKAKLKIRNIQE